MLTRLVLRELTLAGALGNGLVSVDGDAAAVADLFGLLDDFTLMFEVVEPKRPGA
jgi:alkyl sulfatase BDS1-like metallo-beta-lactamase superfamily hydrolase